MLFLDNSNVLTPAEKADARNQKDIARVFLMGFANAAIPCITKSIINLNPRYLLPFTPSTLVFFMNGFLGAASSYAIKCLGEKYHWERSNVVLLKAAAETIIAVALLVASVSLGIMDPLSAGIFCAVELMARLRDLKDFYDLKMEELNRPPAGIAPYPVL